MPWNDTARDQHTRDHLRYPGDLTDRAWALIAPMLPGDFAAVSTGRGDFHGRRDQGPWYASNHLLPAPRRALEDREAGPTAGVTDSQSVKTTEAGGVCGYDAGSGSTATSATS